MANIYVRSTDGNDADSGATWALAKATLAGAAAIAVAGDTVYVSQAHAETQATAMTVTFAGTAGNPIMVICANDAAEPPTAVATTGTVTTTGTSSMTINGSIYCYGLTFNCGTGASTVTFTQKPGTTGGKQLYESCVFNVINTATTSRLALCNTSGGTDTPNEVEWLNCTLDLRNASQNVQVNVGTFKWKGGSIAATSADLTYLMQSSAASSGTRPGNYEIEAVDFSQMAAAFDLAGTTHTAAFLGKFKNCKLPASWSGDLGAFGNPGPRIDMHNCDAGATNYRMWVEDYSGTTKTEATIVHTGGASDGTTPISWRMDSSANCNWAAPLVSPVFSIWNDTTGASKTVTIELVHDTNVAAGQGAGTAFAFQDDEVWVEAEYLGASGAPGGTVTIDRKATILTAAADQTSSSEAWTTTGLTTPVKQKLSVSFTPQMKGFIQCRVYVAKASKTLYVDPKITVS